VLIFWLDINWSVYNFFENRDIHINDILNQTETMDKQIKKKLLLEKFDIANDGDNDEKDR